MFRILFFLSIFFAIPAFSQESLNITLLDEFDRGDERYSGSWSYVQNGQEYGLVGAKTGTAIYSISANGELEELAFIPGPSSNWREITCVGDYAYVVTEGTGAGQGLQVIALGDLPNSASLLTTYDATFQTGHIIQKDIFDEDNRIYICGTNTTSGVHILDISDPANPVEIGLYQPGYYIHDCHVRGDTMYAAAFNEGKLDFVNISDPEELVVFNVLNDPGANTHSCSTTEDHTTLFLADELDGLPGRIFDLTSEEDLDQLALYSANLESLVHNPYIVGNDLAYISHNTEGLRILDIADPRLPVEVGYFDTFDGESGGFFGLWSACPYLPSGRILGGDRWRGLMLFEYNGIQAGRIYLQVVDSITGAILPETDFYFAGDTIALDAEARWSYGTLPTTLTLDFELDQYEPKTMEVVLESQDQLTLLVEMVPEGASVTEPNPSLLTIYPNPATEQIRIEGGLGKGQILIFSALGQELINQTVDGTTAEISIQGLPAGTYWGQWLGGEGVRQYFSFIRK